jgi:hypothetical protein
VRLFLLLLLLLLLPLVLLLQLQGARPGAGCRGRERPAAWRLLRA